MPLTQLYHTRDPIENLRVHVTLRKIASAADEDAAASSVGTTWDYCFRWQEKKLATSQLSVCTSKKTKATHSADEVEDASASSTQQAARSSVLCSYIDADNYVAPKELARSVTTASSSVALTHLAGAQHRRVPQEHGLAAVVPSLWKRNTERAWLRHHREEAFRCMHLVASLDIGRGGKSGDSELVLCAMRFYADTGLLSATPGFSVPIDVDKEDPETTARKGGPKLSTYRATIAGALYEYTLDNVNDLMPLAVPHDEQLLRELQLREQQQDEARVASALAREGSGAGNGAGNGALAQVQQLYYEEMRGCGVVKRKLVLVEVVSARDLCTSESVFVELQLRLPPQQKYQQFYWRLRAPTSKMPDAAATAVVKRTQQTEARAIRSCLSRARRTPSGGTVAVFNLHAQFDLELCTASSSSSRETAPEGTRAARDGRGESDAIQLDPESGDLLAVALPVLSLSVFSRDSWGRKRSEGFGDFAIPAMPGHDDRSVAIAKPVLGVREQLEELFLGADETSGDSIEQLRATNTTLHGVNSRLGVHVQSTGAVIRVRTNVFDRSVVASQTLSRSASVGSRRASASAQIRPHALPELRVVKRSVNEILQSVRLEKRILQSTNGGGGTEMQASAAGLAAASTVESVLARLQAARTAATPSPPPLTGSV